MKDFAAEAERMRRAGDPASAVAIAQTGLSEEPGDDRIRISLALALIDSGDVRRARQALESALRIPVEAPAAHPSHADLGGELGDDELEDAFAMAETNPDEMMSANRVVEQTLENEQVDAPEAGFDVTGSRTYATETMASLLEEQGRRNEAHTLRGRLSHLGGDLLRAEAENATSGGAFDAPAALHAAEGMPVSSGSWSDAGVGPDHARSLRIVATLEGWLYNLRRNAERDSRAGSRTAGGPS